LKSPIILLSMRTARRAEINRITDPVADNQASRLKTIAQQHETVFVPLNDRGHRSNGRSHEGRKNNALADDNNCVYNATTGRYHRRRTCSGVIFLLGLLTPATSVLAQRAFERGVDVIYEDAAMHQTNLGAGLSPVLTKDGKVALIRGRRFDYGDSFDCSRKDTSNRIVLYDPVTKHERTIFDRTLHFGSGADKAFCIYQQMQISGGASTLYLISPVYATSGSMAIVSPRQGSVTCMPGVNLVHLIETGPHRDELIYSRRINAANGPRYPLIHASKTGKPIAEISDEDFTIEGDNDAPILRAYLRKIGGTITIDGKKLP
jgi:hypothetical protein